MLVFIAGASGVLGRALVPLVQARGHAIRALARTAEQAAKLRARGVEPVIGDLLDVRVLHDLPGMLAGCGAAVHAATAIPRDPTTPGAWEATGLLRTAGARRLLDGCQTAGVGQYVQQSILMAYRDGGDTWLAEDWPLDTTPTRASICAPVIAMETLVRNTPPTGPRWTILRGGSFVGPDTGQEVLVERIRAGHAVIPGDGSAFIAPIHVVDMARAVAAALDANLSGATLNVVDEPLRQGAYYDRLAELLGAPRPPHDRRQPRPASFRCRNDAARMALGWQPVHAVWPVHLTEAVTAPGGG